MTFAKQHHKSTKILQWLGILSVTFACTCPVRAQSNWPETFTGLPDMGPYAWVDGPSEVAKNPGLSSAVLGGQEGSIKLYVCRAQLQDGVHTGKFFNGQCNIGWGGQELSLTTGYQLLVNTQPNLANFLPQTWVAPATPAATTFHGGTVGNTQMRVCRASHNNGFHPGKEWAGKCNIGWGGQEIASTSYEVLSLGFNKSNWMLNGASTVVVQPAPTDPTVTVTMPNLTAPLNLNIQQPPPSDPIVVVTRLSNLFLIGTKKWNNYLAVPNLNYTDERRITHSSKDYTREKIATLAMAGSRIDFSGLDSTYAPTWFVKEDVAGRPGWFRIKFLTTNLYVELASFTDGAHLILNSYKDSPLQVFSIEKQTAGDALVAIAPGSEQVVNTNTTTTGLLEILIPNAPQPTVSSGTKYFLTVESVGPLTRFPAKMKQKVYTPLYIREYPTWVYENDGRGRAYPK
jgi:hypothetical protein